MNDRPKLRAAKIRPNHVNAVANNELLDLLRRAGLDRIVEVTQTNPSRLFTKSGRFNLTALGTATGIKKTRLATMLKSARELLEDATD